MKDLGKLVSYTDEGGEVRVIEVSSPLGMVEIVTVVAPPPDLEEAPT